MSRMHSIAAGVLVPVLVSAFLCGAMIGRARGDESPVKRDSKTAEPSRQATLPDPLDGVVTVLGPFAPDFDVEKIEFFEPGEFKTPDPRPRTVEEETIVWTLVAKRDLPIDKLRSLLTGPREQPFPSVSFVNASGNAVPASDVGSKSISQGYALFPYWHRKALAKGDNLKVWTHLGKSGAAELAKSDAAKAVFDAGMKKAAEPAPKP